MLIFHEGLPGSGKSYEAAINQIIPALKKGRQVFAYIEGLNHEMFAEITEIPIDKLRGKRDRVSVDLEAYSAMTEEQKSKVTKSPDGWFQTKFVGLLFQIEKEQVKEIYKHVANDSLVIIDELQDFFPSGMKKLEDGITSFVTQHRHRGLDIIAMGQDHRDCHNLWKRRIDQLYHFVKRDAIGQPTKYTWKSYKLNEGKLTKLRSGSGEYDSRYFGLYASHTNDTTNTDTHTDDRANLLKSDAFRYGLPAAVAAGAFAVYWLYGFFTGGQTFTKQHEPPKPAQQIAPAQPSAPVSKPDPGKSPPVVKTTYSHDSYIDEMVSNNRPRLGAIIEGRNRQGYTVITGMVQFMDDSNHEKERLTLEQLRAFGWRYTRMPYGIKLEKGGKNIVVTAWPIDMLGRVSNSTREELRPRPAVQQQTEIAPVRYVVSKAVEPSPQVEANEDSE